MNSLKQYHKPPRPVLYRLRMDLGHVGGRRVYEDRWCPTAAIAAQEQKDSANTPGLIASWITHFRLDGVSRKHLCTFLNTHTGELR